MSDGALIFAHRSTIDYLHTARVAAILVKRHLNIPVCLVTDELVADSVFDTVVQIDPPTTNNQRYYTLNGQRILGPWFNGTRANAIDYTPWDNTLLIDADYFIFSDQLKTVMNSNLDFACFTQAKDLVSQSQVDSVAGYRTMSWATVCWFTQRSAPVFDMWKKIRDHWDFYNQLCDFNQPVFRNDHALGVALDTISGHLPHQKSIPGIMTNVLPGTTLHDIRADGTVVFETPRGISKIKNTDIHVIDKTICTDSKWLSKLEAVHA